MTNEQLCALVKQGDADVQNLLIENNLRFVKKTAHEVWSTQPELNCSLHIALDDLVQEGALGLLGCIESYNPDSGNLFLTYAAPAIRNAMIDYICSPTSPKIWIRSQPTVATCCMETPQVRRVSIKSFMSAEYSARTTTEIPFSTIKSHSTGLICSFLCVFQNKYLMAIT